MPARKELIINLGNSQVSAYEFSLSPKGTSLIRTGSRLLAYDENGESNWVQSIQHAIRELCKELKLKGAAKIILPSNQLLSKTLRVPKVEQLKQRKIVSYELGQKMPFPLAELIWDYQVIDDDGIEQEILAFAVKPAFIDEVCQIAYDCGLLPTHLCPGPILDNVVLQASKRLNDIPEKLLINFGARSTNLLFANESGYLVRNISTGGNFLTEALSDHFGLSYEKSEELKLNYFSQKLNLNQDDPATEILKNVANNYYNKIGQEITRSIVTYKRLKKGKSPKLIIATGRPAKNQELIKFLSESQQLPVVPVDLTDFLKMDDRISEKEADELPFCVTEALGFAIASTTSEKDQKLINLLPQERLTSLEFKKKKKWILMSALMVAVLPLPKLISLKQIQENESEDHQKLVLEVKEKKQTLSQIAIQKKSLEFHQKVNLKSRDYLNQFTQKSLQLYAQSRLINNLQNVTEKRGIENIWFDSLHTQDEDTGNTNLIPYKETEVPIKVEGRYLVSPDNYTDLTAEELRNILIDSNSKIQEILIDEITSIPQVVQVARKVFSTEGKGDLFERYFTHFEFEILIDLKR